MAPSKYTSVCCTLIRKVQHDVSVIPETGEAVLVILQFFVHVPSLSVGFPTDVFVLPSKVML